MFKCLTKIELKRFKQTVSKASMWVTVQARSQDFSWGAWGGGGGGGAFWRWAVKIQTCRGVWGHAPPGKF